jgi:hypothetical protein
VVRKWRDKIDVSLEPKPTFEQARDDLIDFLVNVCAAYDRGRGRRGDKRCRPYCVPRLVDLVADTEPPRRSSGLRPNP